ncbi:MAG: hypothetical protein HKN47_21330 [Pirellulaceae bacterium]|nr:hypothetical protein [Pirellulaceae bacterium]
MNGLELLPHPESTFAAINNILKHVEAPRVREQRISERQQILQPISVQSLDDQFQPVGTPFEALSRDVSVSGVGFFSIEPVDARFIKITFDCCDDINDNSFFAEVMHQSPRGPVSIVGCKILANWNADSDEG